MAYLPSLLLYVAAMLLTQTNFACALAVSKQTSNYTTTLLRPLNDALLQVAPTPTPSSVGGDVGKKSTSPLMIALYVIVPLVAALVILALGFLVVRKIRQVYAGSKRQDVNRSQVDIESLNPRLPNGSKVVFSANPTSPVPSSVSSLSIPAVNGEQGGDMKMHEMGGRHVLERFDPINHAFAPHDLPSQEPLAPKPKTFEEHAEGLQSKSEASYEKLKEWRMQGQNLIVARKMGDQATGVDGLSQGEPQEVVGAYNSLSNTIPVLLEELQEIKNAKRSEQESDSEDENDDAPKGDQKPTAHNVDSPAIDGQQYDAEDPFSDSQGDAKENAAFCNDLEYESGDESGAIIAQGVAVKPDLAARRSQFGFQVLNPDSDRIPTPTSAAFSCKIFTDSVSIVRPGLQ